MQRQQRYCLIWGSLAYLILSLLAFIAGLILQNLWFPSPRTAAAGWLLYFTPFIAIASMVMGLLLSYLGYRLAALRICPWLVLVLSMTYGIAISWGYWMVWVSMFLATMVFYQLIKMLSCSDKTR